MIVEGIEKSTVPNFSLISRVSSSPSWLEPKTCTAARPASRALARRANSSADSATSEPGEATCAKRNLRNAAALAAAEQRTREQRGREAPHGSARRYQGISRLV